MAKSRDEEQQEEPVISLTNAVVQPGAVMIMILNAYIANIAVLARLGYQVFTVRTEMFGVIHRQQRREFEVVSIIG